MRPIFMSKRQGVIPNWWLVDLMYILLLLTVKLVNFSLISKRRQCLHSPYLIASYDKKGVLRNTLEVTLNRIPTDTPLVDDCICEYMYKNGPLHCDDNPD